MGLVPLLLVPAPRMDGFQVIGLCDDYRQHRGKRKPVLDSPATNYVNPGTAGLASRTAIQTPAAPVTTEIS